MSTGVGCPLQISDFRLLGCPGLWRVRFLSFTFQKAQIRSHRPRNIGSVPREKTRKYMGRSQRETCYHHYSPSPRLTIPRSCSSHGWLAEAARGEISVQWTLRSAGTLCNSPPQPPAKSPPVLRCSQNLPHSFGAAAGCTRNARAKRNPGCVIVSTTERPLTSRTWRLHRSHPDEVRNEHPTGTAKAERGGRRPSHPTVAAYELGELGLEAFGFNLRSANRARNRGGGCAAAVGRT